MLRPAQRRLVFLTTAFALSLLSCGREVTGPDNGILTGRRIGSVAIAPEMPALMQLVDGASEAVPFTKVRIVLRNEDGSVARDTLVDFPSTADSVALSLLLPIPNTAPDSGLVLSLTMAYVNAAGDTVFRGGPSAIIARPVGSSGANVPVVIPVSYDGVGKDAASVLIAPLSGVGVAGTSQTFTATAFGANNQPIANTPFVFFTLDPTRVQVGAASGVATWLPVRGTARIVAALPNGLRADTAEFLVSLPASKLVLGSGNAQTGAVNAPLSDSIVVRTLASDDVPVAGVIVSFAVANGGGTLSVATDTSDADGSVSTRWTLGSALGAQGITATATGLSGSPLAVTATSVAGTPTRLDITAQPTTGVAGTTLAPALVVTARDAFGNVATTFTANVSVAVLATNPPPLGGTATRPAVNGIATFNDLSLTAVGSYLLGASSGTLTPDTSAAIGITPAAAARLEFGVQPLAAVAGAALTPPLTLRALDAFGNLDTAFTGSVNVQLLNAGSATLSGTSTVNAVNGVASFPTLSVNLTGSSYALRASAGALTPDTSTAFSISAAAASQLVMSTQPPDTVTAGLPFAIAARTRDAFGNDESAFGDSITVAIQSGPTGAVLGGITRRVATGGVVSFTGLTVDLAGNYQLTVGAPGLSSASSISFTARAGVPATLSRISGDAQSAPLGTALANPLIVQVRDAGGNTVSGATVQWTIVSGTASFGSATVISDASGLAATTVTLGSTLGAVTLRATVTGIAPVDFTATALPGAAVYPNVLTAPSGGTAGVALPAFSYGVFDQFDNLATGYSGVARVTVEPSNITQPTPVILSGDSVDVIAGVGTWNALVLATAGQFRIVADFGPALGDYVSSIFTISPGAPALLVNVSGSGQSAPASTPVANPLRARVTDGNGNGVSGVNVNFNVISGIATLGGSATSSAVVATDSSGFADVSVQAGTQAGAVLIGAFAAGLTPDSLLYNVTVTAGAASGFTVLSGASQVLPAGGSSDTVRVRLDDIYGNPIVGATVTWNQTTDLTFAPSSSVTDANGIVATVVTTGGQLGVKSFSASSAPASDASLSMEVVAAAADSLNLLRGNNQTGFAASALDSLIVLRIADRFGNPRVGDTAFVSVSSGGGLLGNGLALDTTTTDAQGEISIAWTLGLTLGTQSLSVSSGSLAAVTVSATAVSPPENVWAGSLSTDWTNAGNWSLGVLPNAGTAVRIPPSTPFEAIVGIDAIIGSLNVEGGANLGIADTWSLSVLSNILVDGGIAGPGLLIFAPSSTGNLSAPGSIAVPFAISTGIGGTDGGVVLNGNVNIVGGAGQVMLVGAGSLDINGFTLDVDGDLVFAGTGSLVMGSPTSTVTVRQTAVFNGASTLNSLTAGTLNIEGDFVQSNAVSASSFAATGDHLTRFIGSVATVVTFISADSTQSRFADVAFAKADGDVSFSGPGSFAMNDITFWDGAVLVNDATLIVRGTLTQPVVGHALILGTNGFMNILGVNQDTCNGVLITHGPLSVETNLTPQPCWDPPSLVVATPPTNGAEAGGLLSPVTVELRSSGGTVLTSYNGPVTLELVTNPTSTILMGTTTVNAVDGVATFDEVAVGLPGTGYQLRATQGSFAWDSSAVFTVVDPVVPVDSTSLAASTLQGAASYCGVSSSGSAYCWGANSRGTLGTADLLSRVTPTAVTGGLTFQSISGGNGHMCGIVASGDAYCWGRNESGQIGNGSASGTVLIPTLVVGGHTWRSIRTGTLTSCGLNTVGEAYCWGGNQGGRIGDGTETQRNTPTPVGVQVRFVELSVGAFSACGRTAAGYLHCWGINNGHIGNGVTGNTLSPVPGGGGLRYSKISLAAFAGSQSALTCGVTVDEANLCWGNNTNGGFANGGSSGTFLSPVPGLTGLVPSKLSLLEGGRGCATDLSGNASCWGRNFGSLGNGNFFTESFTPMPVSGGIQFDAVAPGPQSACGISSTGSVYCWGAENPVALGGAAPTYLEPTLISIASNGSTLELGSTGTACTRSAGGVASCWGSNFQGVSGTLGTGSNDEFVISPQTLSGGESFVDLALGFSSCGVNTAGTLLCWGQGFNFGLATSSTPSTVPVAVSSALQFTSVSRGQTFGCALDTSGAMSCWGINTSGELGRGITSGPASIDFAVGPTFDQIEIGNQHGCGRTGTVVRCWGANSRGQLGDGTTTLRPAPTVAVSGGHLAQSVYVSANHSCLLTTTSEARCWGDGTSGQMGNAAASGVVSSPVAPTGGLTFTQLALGSAHTCGLTTGGATYCWGSNSFGQVGDGTFGVNRLTPTLVSTAPSFVSIRAGGNTTCGITSSEAVYCWGDGLGRFGVAPQLTPAPVAGGITFRTP